MIYRTAVRCLVAGASLAIPGVAFGDLVAFGTYHLSNHPDGNAQPPQYGLRLDELYNATGNHDIFTFDFNHAQSNMSMDYNGTSIHIYGQAWGGRDTGSGYANDGYRGVYVIDFTYNIGVGLAPGDDDVLVNPGLSYNYGSIQTPLGHTIGLRDGHYSGGQPDFRFGDENNDAGHRGFDGLSGWGWLFTQTGAHGSYVNHASDDWLFTATLVPTPGAAALMGLGAVAGLRRRRR
ncbi:MAG TPA: hypothetical protein VFF65_03935 [Phycisphaerales bacterium]|nr:hypothetical protein [Phycisphaerales bacterium]